MKNRIVVLSILYCFLCQPFIISGTYLPEFLGFAARFVLIIIIIAMGSPFKRMTSKEAFWSISLFLYFIIHSIINPVYIKQVILVIPDLFFLFVILLILKRNIRVCEDFYRAEVALSVIIAAIIVVCKLAYTYIPSLFSFREIDGYPTYFNPILGIVNPGKNRPSWYFAEPSYSGFFLGVNFFFLLYYEFKRKRKKILALILLALGIYSTASMGSYAFFALAFPFILIQKTRINKEFVSLIVILLVLLVGSIASTYDLFSIDQDFFDLASHGASGRQERMENANAIMEKATFLNILFGNGLECIGLTYKVGISDAYHKLFCEWGYLFSVVFFIFVWKLTHKNLPAFVFISFSYFSVIIHMAPIVVIIYYLIYYQSRLTEGVRKKQLIINQLANGQINKRQLNSARNA